MPAGARRSANAYIRKVNAVTPNQISDVATDLQDVRATIVIVGDRKVIEEQVRAFGNISP